MNICAECRHFRQRTPVNPFGKSDVWTPDILDAKVKWDQEQNELLIMEQQRYQSGDEFDFEPNSYPWCAYWTNEEGNYIVDPVSGNRARIYILCARVNLDGQCKQYEATK